jgi:hypothetical protein
MSLGQMDGYILVRPCASDAPVYVYGAVLEDHEIVGGPYNNISDPVYRTSSMGGGAVEEKLPGTSDYPRAPSRHLLPRR